MNNEHPSPQEGSINANKISSSSSQSDEAATAYQNAILVDGNNNVIIFNKFTNNDLRIVVPEGFALNKTPICSRSLKVIATDADNSTTIAISQLPEHLCILASTQQPTNTTVEEDEKEPMQSEERYEAALSTYVKEVEAAVAELEEHTKEIESGSGAANTTALKEYVAGIDAKIENNKAKIEQGASITNHTLLNSLLSSLKDGINERIGAVQENATAAEVDANEKLKEYHHAFLHTVQVAREEFERNITALTSATSNKHSKRNLLSSNAQEQTPTIPSSAIDPNLPVTDNGSFTTMRLRPSSKFRITQNHNGSHVIATVRKIRGAYGNWDGILREVAHGKPNSNANTKRDVDAEAARTVTSSFKLIFLPQNASAFPLGFWDSKSSSLTPGKVFPPLNVSRVRPHRLPPSSDENKTHLWRGAANGWPRIKSLNLTNQANLTRSLIVEENNRPKLVHAGISKYELHYIGNITKMLEKAQAAQAEKYKSSKAVPRSNKIDITEPANLYHRIFSGDNPHLEAESGSSSREHLTHENTSVSADFSIVIALRSPAKNRGEVIHGFFDEIDKFLWDLGGKQNKTSVASIAPREYNFSQPLNNVTMSSNNMVAQQQYNKTNCTTSETSEYAQMTGGVLFKFMGLMIAMLMGLSILGYWLFKVTRKEMEQNKQKLRTTKHEATVRPS
ncbi:hypothetical protein ACMFMG_000522 [Clarireedia jacksonii]